MKDKLTEILERYRGTSIPTDEVILEILQLICKPEDKSLEGRKQAFIEELRPYIQVHSKEVCNKFGSYWLEISPKGKRYRFEKEKVFSIKQRLNTWVANQKKFSIVNMIKQR